MRREQEAAFEDRRHELRVLNPASPVRVELCEELVDVFGRLGEQIRQIATHCLLELLLVNEAVLVLVNLLEDLLILLEIVLFGDNVRDEGGDGLLELIGCHYVPNATLEDGFHA